LGGGAATRPRSDLDRSGAKRGGAGVDVVPPVRTERAFPRSGEDEMRRWGAQPCGCQREGHLAPKGGPRRPRRSAAFENGAARRGTTIKAGKEPAGGHVDGPGGALKDPRADREIICPGGPAAGEHGWPRASREDDGTGRSGKFYGLLACSLDILVFMPMMVLAMSRDAGAGAPINPDIAAQAEGLRRRGREEGGAAPPYGSGPGHLLPDAEIPFKTLKREHVGLFFF